MDRRYRIYCLSARADSQLIWGHYADHHRGVCLEFDERTKAALAAAKARGVRLSMLPPKLNRWGSMGFTGRSG